MFGENVRNTCWRERYTRDDVKRKHQCLGRMSETHVGGSFFKKRFTRDDIKGRH